MGVAVGVGVGVGVGAGVGVGVGVGGVGGVRSSNAYMLSSDPKYNTESCEFSTAEL